MYEVRDIVSLVCQIPQFVDLIGVVSGPPGGMEVGEERKNRFCIVDRYSGYLIARDRRRKVFEQEQGSLGIVLDQIEVAPGNRNGCALRCRTVEPSFFGAWLEYRNMLI